LTENTKSECCVKRLPLAISNRAGELAFTDLEHSPQQNKMTISANSTRTVRVHGTTLDAFCSVSRIEQISFAKIGVEGTVPVVLRGGMECSQGTHRLALN
jgi:FkbM family methyltransferase